MPRNGSGVYSLPAGVIVSNGETIDASQHNPALQDFATDANTVRPIVAGGTGASTAAGAIAALGITATAAELNIMDGVTATAAELNVLDGLTATTAELNQLDGITLGTAAQLSKSGLQIGYAYVTDTVQHTVTAVIPWNSTAPQVAAGQAVKSITYTPEAVGSTLRISVDVPLIDTDGAGTTVILALFVDGAANAAKSAVFTGSGAGYAESMSFVHHLTVASAAAMNISLRAGVDASPKRGFLNFAYTNQTLGGTAGLTISVTETAA